MSKTETASCESCGASIEAGAEECPECGNSPGDVVRNAGVLVVFVGGATTTVNIPAGAAIVALGVVVAAVGRIKTFEVSEWDLNISD